MRLFRRHESGESPADAAATAQPPTDEPPTLEQLTNDEIDWVRTNLAALSEQDVVHGDIDDLGRHYDELLSVWCRLSESQRPDPAPVTTQIGLGFGQYVADHARLEWVVASDRRGTEIALHGTRGNVLLYPTAMVAEKWADHETGVLPALARSLVAMVDELP